MSQNGQRLEELVDRVASQALRLGADSAEVLLAEGSELEVKVRLGKTELIQEASSRGLGLRIFRERRAAITYTSDFGPALDNFVAESVALAGLSQPDELHELPEENLYARQLPELDLWDERALGTTAQQAIEQAQKAEQAARDYSPKVTNSDGASYSRTFGERALAMRSRGGRGFLGSYRGTYQSLVVEPICDDQEGKKRNGVYWTGSRFLDQLESPEAVGREAARRTVAQLGPEKIATACLPVVFDADAGRNLLGTLFGCLAGSAIYRRTSYLADRENTQVASPLVTIVDDPLLPRAPGSRPFDGEGLTARRNTIVEAGVLKSYLWDNYSARKLGRISNGCAGRSVGGAPHVTTSNFLLLAGATPEEELVSTLPRGLYVTHLMGFGFNPTTGDFSRGVTGFLIENGHLGRPVSEITVSANFNDLWRSIDAVGDRLELKTSVACPRFRVSNMMVAGR